MGVGLYLYFWVIRIMAVVFLLAALLSTPSMLLNGEVRERKRERWPFRARDACHGR